MWGRLIPPLLDTEDEPAGLRLAELEPSEPDVGPVRGDWLDIEDDVVECVVAGTELDSTSEGDDAGELGATSEELGVPPGMLGVDSGEVGVVSEALGAVCGALGVVSDALGVDPAELGTDASEPGEDSEELGLGLGLVGQTGSSLPDSS